MSAVKIRIKNWHTVAEWKWNVSEENCGICQMQFDAHCTDCKIPGDDCPPGTVKKKKVVDRWDCQKNLIFEYVSLFNF